MEVVAALLKELLILSRILRLLGLLGKSARADLSLRALQCSLLRTSAKPGKLLGRSSTHRVALLTKASKPLRNVLAHTKLLLTKPSQLLAHLLQCRAVCLLSPQIHTLLLLSSLKSLLIALLIQRRDCLRLREALLAAQCLPLQSSALATKSTSTNGL